MKKLIAGTLAILGVAIPSLALADSATWWLCVAEVPQSKTVGVKMSWVGPAGRWNEVHNTYLASFDTQTPHEQAPALKDTFASEYQVFLVTSGYDLTPGISGRSTDVLCLYYRTEVERTRVAAELSTGREERQGVKLELRPTYVRWQPKATQISDPAAIAVEVQKAADLAIAAEKAARVKAAEAEEVALRAKEIGIQAEAEAQKARQGQAGYEVGTYTDFGSSHKVYYAGQRLDDQVSALGVTTYEEDSNIKSAGQTVRLTVDSGTGPVISGLGAVILSPTGSYAGQMKEGHLDGLGIAIIDGNKIAGQIKVLILNGPGVLSIEAGEAAGEFSENQLNGYGVITLRDGSRRIGRFIGNQLDGPGIEYAPDATQKKGMWANGTLVVPLP